MSRRRRGGDQESQMRLGPLHELMALMGGMQQMGNNQSMVDMSNRQAEFEMQQAEEANPYNQVSARNQILKELAELQSLPGFGAMLGANEEQLSQIGVPRNTFPMLDDQQYMEIIGNLYAKERQDLDPQLRGNLMKDQSVQARTLREMLAKREAR